MKIIFIPLKFVQLTSTIVIIVAVFMPCEILRKDNDKAWLFRTRHYSIYDPSAIYDLMTDDIHDVSGTTNLFKILYAAVGFSIPTGLVIGSLFVCHYVCKLVCYRLRLVAHILLIAFWIPFTFAFVWTVTFSWADDAILSNYGRPTSWVVAVGGSLTLTIFLTLELIFTVVLLSRSPSFDIYNTNNSNAWVRDYWKKGNRLAISLNSINLDPNCEKLKPEEL